MAVGFPTSRCRKTQFRGLFQDETVIIPASRCSLHGVQDFEAVRCVLLVAALAASSPGVERQSSLSHGQQRMAILLKLPGKCFLQTEGRVER